MGMDSYLEADDNRVLIRTIGERSVHRRPFLCYLNDRTIERKFEQSRVKTEVSRFREQSRQMLQNI